MKNLIYLLLAAFMCCAVVSCNEKPIHYKFVIVANDGTEKVEELTAENDTDALNQYIKRMEKILIMSVMKGEEPDFKGMFVISPNGDTLNTNKGLLDAVSEDIPATNVVPLEQVQPTGEAPAATDAPAAATEAPAAK